MSNLLLKSVLGFCLCCVFIKSGYCSDQSAKDFLIERWYETEFIVFEYLSTLPFNEPEELVLTKTRQWPSLLVKNSSTKSNEVLPDSTDLTNLIKSNNYENELLEEITRIDNRCWGYPALPRKDPLREELLALGITLERIDNFQRSSHLEIDHEMLTFELDSPVEQMKVEDSIQDHAANDSPPSKLNSSSLVAFLSEAAKFETQLHSSAFKWLSKETFSLKEEYLALRRARGVRPIYHGRWRQPVPERDAAIPILLQLDGSDGLLTYDRNLHKIEGTVHVTAKKFLHLYFNLWHHVDAIGQAPMAVPNTVDLIKSRKHGYMELIESRRMRSSELHYLDHPKIGIIAQIEEVKLPSALEELFALSTKTSN